MANEPIRNSSQWPSLVLRRADQACVGAILGASLLIMAAYWMQQAGHRGQWIEIERAEPLAIDFQVDLNTADWPELTLLPGIGESLARRIVESRGTQGPFLDHDDLRRVKGIGPKTLDRVRPYLVPLADANEIAGP